MSLPYLLYAAGVVCLVVALFCVLAVVHMAWAPWLVAGVVLIIVGYFLGARSGRPMV